MSEKGIFEIASMAPLYTGMTLAYFLLALAAMVAPIPPGTAMGIFMIVMGIFIRLWSRPATFEVDDEFLMIHWPLRKRRIGRADIEGARRLEFSELGPVIRMGVGGVWGSFGLFKTGQEGLIDGYFTRRRDLVLLSLKHDRPLLISPEDAGAFVKSLQILTLGGLP